MQQSQQQHTTLMLISLATNGKVEDVKVTPSFVEGQAGLKQSLFIALNIIVRQMAFLS